MISQEESKALTDYRVRVYKMVKKAVESPDCCHKSCEGAVDLTIGFPDLFDVEAGCFQLHYVLTLHAYVIGPGRNYEYTGSSLKECLNKANADLDEWDNWQDNEISPYDC